MAQATVTQAIPAVTKIVVVTPEQPAIVTITMSLEEARTLRKVCARIGGNPETTKRGDMDAIARALDSVGVEKIDAEVDRVLNAIYFTA